MRRCLFPCLLTLALLAAPGVRAMESPPVQSPRVTATLVSDTDTAAPGRSLRIGLRLRLAPGWHTYWKNPGDAGQAPSLDLTLPPGVTAGPIAWPAPQVQREGDLVTYGYQGDVLLPVRLQLPAAGPGGAGTAASGVPGAVAAAARPPDASPLEITAQASWLACERICVPESGRFRLTLPPGPGAASAEAPLFAAAAAAMPRPQDGAELAPDGTLTVHDPARALQRLRGAVFVPDQPGRLDSSAAQPLTVAAGTGAGGAAGEGTLTLRLRLLPAHAVAPLSGVLLLADADGRTRALALTAAPVEGPPQAAMPFAEALGGAFLAGLLLNLMPCVFPVLAMKALAVARLSGAARGRVRAHALSYTAGVLAAFALLAAVMLALRAAGAAAGWGFQFQSPAFVAGMAWLMFGVGLSLSGALSFGSTMAGAGQSLAGRGGHAGSFFTGLLAVVVATPCTAPFMGAALATALAAAAPMTFGVFLAMGLGLAAPYLLLAALPRLGVALPRPGRWMEILKQALAFPMYGAAAWLVWVISEEAGPPGVLAALAGLVLLGFAAWAHGLSLLPPAAEARHSASRSLDRPAARRVAQAAAAAACLAALAVLPGIAALPPAAPAAEEAGLPGGVGHAAGGRVLGARDAEPFSAARLAALRAAGRPVFVNMTAAWCITCLVNERIALAPPAVADAFAAHGVAYLRGDWTRQDPEITAFLHAHARDGVPLYVFYPAGGGPGEVLPQLLTAHAVLARVAAGGA